MNRAWESRRDERRERKRREREGRADHSGRGGHRRKQRPGRHERTAQRDGDVNALPNDAARSERRGGPRTPYVEQRAEQATPGRKSSLRGRRGPR
jgi:hypothetical protein